MRFSFISTIEYDPNLLFPTSHSSYPIHNLKMKCCCCNESDQLASSLAEHPAIIAVAYIAVIFPWAVLYNFDFISEKWRTIYDTRKSSYMHLVVSLVPMGYILYYAHLQRISKDYKEMMTAVVGILMCIYHVTRTSMGMMQLNVFWNWSTDLVERMKILSLIPDFRFQQYESSDVVDWKSLLENMNKILKVNKSIVDNELTGNDVDVSPSIYKIGFRNPSKWLKTKEGGLCTVRWSGAFLSSFGEHWSGFEYGSILQELFASCEKSLDALIHRVTFPVDGTMRNLFWKPIIGDYGTLWPSLKKLEPLAQGNLIGAYGTVLPSLKTLEPRDFALQNLMSSYHYSADDSNTKYRPPAMELVRAILYSKMIDLETLSQLQAYSSQFFTSENPMGWRLFLMQQGEFPEEADSVILDPNRLPPFPWRKLLVPLWSTCTNWRVLQATAHMDNHSSIDLTNESDSPQYLPNDYFEYTRQKIFYGTSDRTAFSTWELGYVGCVMEMVRSFLADWLTRPSGIEPDWNPTLPLGEFEFSVSEFGYNVDKLKWKCQCALQKKISEKRKTEYNLPASVELIMLFILSFPRILEQNNSKKVDPFLTSGPSQDNGIHPSLYNKSRSSKDEYTRISILRTETYHSSLGPQDIKVHVHVRGNINVDKKTVVMKLVSSESPCVFKWEDWMNAGMGFLKGVDDIMDRRQIEEPFHLQQFRKRSPKKVDLTRPMINISISDHGSSGSGVMRVWTAWPIFDVKVAQFEINEWMLAAGYISDFSEAVYPKSEYRGKKFKEELRYAEEALNNIMEWSRF